MKHPVRTVGVALLVAAALGPGALWPGHGAMAGAPGQEASTEAVAVPRVSRVPAQVRTFRTAKDMTSQSKSLQIAPGRFPDAVIETSGLAGASAQKMSGRVWVMAMRDGMAPEDFAKAGFKSPALSFGGTDAIRGVTATSEVVIGSLELGGEWPALAVFAIGLYRNGVLVASGRAMLDRPGTFRATTSPVDLAPGASYHLEACLSVVPRSAASSRGVVPAAEIKEIRWSF